MITSSEWLGVMLASESDRPHEWPAIGQIAVNRRDDRKREFRSLLTMRDVILQPRAWSYFDKWTTRDPMPPDEEIFAAALDGYPGKRFEMAQVCAEDLLNAAPWEVPFGAEVLFCWAPQSMRPRGSDPAWAHGLRIIELPAINRWRFAAYNGD